MALSISNTLKKPFGLDGLLSAPGLGGGFGIANSTPAFNLPKQPAAASPVTAPASTGQVTAPPVTTSAAPAQSQFYNAPATQTSALNTNTGGTAGIVTPPSTTAGVGAAGATQQQGSQGLFPNIVSSLAQKASGPSQFTSQALKEYEDAVTAQKKLKGDIATQYAKIEGGYGGHGIPLEFIQGRENQLANRSASLESAAASEVASRATALSAGTAQQQAEQSGLQQAGSLAQPQLGQYGQTYYNPTEQTGGDAGQLVGGWASYLAGGGDPSQVPSTVSGNAVLWQQTLQAAKQQNPNFDVNSASGAANARAQTAGLTSGLAGAQANTTIVNQGKQEIAQMQASLNTADQNVQNLAGIMQQSGINNFNAVPLNNIANVVRANLSDGAVLSYQTLLAGTRALLTSVYISRGLAPTDASATADATLGKATTLQALIDQYNTSKSEATNLIQNKQAQITQAEQGLNQTSGAGGANTASGANPWH